ncbi:MAG: 1,4-dihydroxy-2-naphthoate polyprenyltransferase [Bacteroidota bacterium]|nr:1,4-dihydroxy-2-naphthoate polyprenyltransferase [Bacteroidota bacterium]
MNNIHSWIKAARLRTLPLSLSCIFMGCFLAAYNQTFNRTVAILAVLTTLFLQILSNFANDYGDSEKGTDNEHRIGPKRTVQAGEITPKAMQAGIMIMAALASISGLFLVLTGIHGMNQIKVTLFLILGLAAIIAALKYTVGDKPYGYMGLGDFFVFLFFGLTGVSGTYFLHAQTVNADIWLMASSIGLFSIGVLNLNNMRDIENDRNSGKHTIPVRLGNRKAKLYHTALILSGMICGLIYLILNYQSPVQLLFILSFPFFIIQLVQICKTEEPRMLDPYLKKLSLSTLLYTLLFGIGFLLS